MKRALVTKIEGRPNKVMEDIEELVEQEYLKISDDFDRYCGYDKMEDWQIKELYV